MTSLCDSPCSAEPAGTPGSLSWSTATIEPSHRLETWRTRLAEVFEECQMDYDTDG